MQMKLRSPAVSTIIPRSLLLTSS